MNSFCMSNHEGLLPKVANILIILEMGCYYRAIVSQKDDSDNTKVTTSIAKVTTFKVKVTTQCPYGKKGYVLEL